MFPVVDKYCTTLNTKQTSSLSRYRVDQYQDCEKQYFALLPGCIAHHSRVAPTAAADQIRFMNTEINIDRLRLFLLPPL